MVGPVTGLGLVEPALTDPPLIGEVGQEPLQLGIIELRLTGNHGVAGQVALGVVVLVTLLRLPAEEPTL